MRKRGGLGFQERDAFKRKKRKKEEKGRFGRQVFLEGIRDYLLSDSYMYAPLLSPAVSPLDHTVKKTPLSTRGMTEKRLEREDIAEFPKKDGRSK